MANPSLAAALRRLMSGSALLERAGQQEPQPALHIRGDRAVRYERVAQAMAELSAAGLDCDEHGVPRFDHRSHRCGDAPVFVAGDVGGWRPVLPGEPGYEEA